MAREEVRWGILGLGSIAGQFAEGLKHAPGARLVAVGSREQAKAEMFGKKFGAPHRHGNYEDLATDPEVDIVYVATPHPMHCENTLLCLEHGKAVLCEKPFAINAAEGEAMVAAARKRGLFLMEAMWPRFFPLMAQLRERVAAGAIGDLVMVQADFGFRAGFNPKSRLFDPHLGGGALLDVGVYPLSFASMLLGTPDYVAGAAHRGQTGVDEVAGMVLRYPAGQVALLGASIRTTTFQEALVLGTTGRIRIHSPWWKPSAMTLVNGDGEQTIDPGYEGNGYTYEAVEAMNRLRQGVSESPVMPLDETLAVLRTMDTLRKHWGVRYPGEGL